MSLPSRRPTHRSSGPPPAAAELKRWTSAMQEPEDPLIRELRTFLGSYAEHDPDCPAFEACGPAVRDPANCICGLTSREQELIAKLEMRLNLVAGEIDIKGEKSE
jgi:hypothetical protein